MRQVSGIDSMFLAVESDRWPMHIASIHVIDPSTAPEPLTLDVVKDHLRSKLPLLGGFRQRLLQPPLGLGRPYWVDDPAFDLDYHVRRIGVPYPGRREDFGELVADIASRPLDRSRPLWEWWFVEGLEHGYVACIWKIHHAYIDGVSWVALGDVFYDKAPTPRPAPTEDGWEPEATPATIPLLVRTVVDLGGIPRRLARVGVAGLSAGRRYRGLRPRFDPGDGALAPSEGPPARVSFNGPVTRRRSWAAATVSLDDIKIVKDAAGVKVNDVVLAVCAGALRRYLAERDELPDRPLVAAVPVSIRSDDGRSAGNQISAMTVPLATDLDDPVDRLRTIYASTQRSKVMQKALGAEVIMELVDTPPPVLVWLGSALLAWSGLARRMPPVANVIVSNVPGPRETLYFAGGEIMNIHSTGVVIDEMGLFVGLGSYRGQVDFSVTACKDLVPDPWRIVDVIEEELQALVKALG